jgi:hypothetical protein
MIFAVTVLFIFLGAHTYANDVALIESEMVETAKWIQGNIPSDARLAVHDIGALGYYVENPLVDMAGLISPEVVPFIRDEKQLAEFLDAKSVDYLVAFPSLYPELTTGRESLFEAGSEAGPLDFDENMHVFRWK